jgi:hypothetical protein
VDEKGVTTRKDIDGYGYNKSLAELVRRLNEVRAQSQDKRESELRIYAQWQQDRTRNWSEQPLLARAA